VSKVQYPFLVFGESVPEAALLADPKTPADEKERLRFKVDEDIRAARRVANRDTQRGRHRENHERRDAVMQGLVRDKRGKPMRGEPRRLAKLHNLPVIKVRKWIEQLRVEHPGASAVRDDWRTVVYGRMLRHQHREVARKPRS
jgi:hypothetical protein